METNESFQRRKLSLTFITIFAITAWLGTASQSDGAGGWTNEQSGMTVVLDCPFSGGLCSGMFNVYSNQPFSTLTLGGQQPASPTGLLDYYLPVASGEGGGQFGIDFNQRLGHRVREVYMATWWATNADFSGSRNNGNKMLFITGPANVNYLNWKGAPFTSRQLTWENQSAENNCHVSGYNGACGDGATPASGHFVPNSASNGVVATNSGWHLIEIYQRASTTGTSRDGIIKIWVDGILSSNYTNLNLSPAGFDSVQYNSTWNVGCEGQNIPGYPLAWYRDCSKEWHHYYDHLRVSVGLGASVDQHPGPPAAPKIFSVIVSP